MSANDEQKECGRILADYASDMIAPNPIDTAVTLANAGFGTEAGVILSCIFSTGPRIHPLPRGFTAVAIYKFDLRNESDDGVIDDVSNDVILLVFGVDVTRPPPPGKKPTATAYCYRLRYASFGKISHVYPCTNEELKKYYDMALSGTQSETQESVQQTPPPRRLGLRRRRAEELEEREKEEEPEGEEEEEEENEDEQ
jgi:hypothetical protein